MSYIINQKGVEFDPVFEIVEPWQEETARREMHYAGQLANELAVVYPGYYWLVNVNFQGGICTLECGQITGELMSNMPYAMVIHLNNLFDWGITRRKLVFSAGELLERAFLRRGKWDASYPTQVHGVRSDHQPWKPKIITLEEYMRRSRPDIELIAA